MLLAIGTSCIWGLIKIWKSADMQGRGRGPDYLGLARRPSSRRSERPDSPAPLAVDSAAKSPTDQKPFDDDAFEAWLKASGLASTDLPPERLFELRQAFLKEG